MKCFSHTFDSAEMLNMHRVTLTLAWLVVLALSYPLPASAQTRPPLKARRFQILTTNLPAPVAGQAYEAHLDADGGRPPYRWSFAAEPVPSWVRLDQATGTLSGFPSSDEQFSIAVRVTDSSGSGNFVTRVLYSIPVMADGTRPRALQIITPNLPSPVAGQKYLAQVRAVGGKLPYHWSIPVASLPPNLVFDEGRGVISGVPESSNEFSVLLQLQDSSDPPITITKLLAATSGAPLTVRWTAVPHVNATNISGAVRVSNGSKDRVDMTVIVVAVNEIGKAFSLRYEHQPLDPGIETPDLIFDVPVPLGHYTVHVDAAGEVAAKNAIYRDRREVEGLAVVTP